MTRRPKGLLRGMVRSLSWSLHRAHLAALRHPVRTLTFTVIVVVGLTTQLPKTQVHLSITDIVDPHLPSTPRLRAMERQFGSERSVVLLFRARDGAFSSAEIIAIRDWLRRQETDVEQIRRIDSPFPLLDRVGVGNRMTPEALRSVVDTPWGGILVDRFGTDIAAEVVYAETPGGSRYGRFDPSPIADLQEDLQATLLAEHAGIEATAVGNATYDQYALDGIRRFRKLNALVVVLLLVASRVVLGTWRSGSLLILVLGTAGVVVYGAMAATGAAINLLSTGLFLLLALAAIEDFYFLAHEQLRGHSWRRSFRRVLVPSFFTSLTTVIGFLSLTMSGIQIVQQLGAWAALGAMVEWLTTFLVLPALLAVVHAGPRWTDRRRSLGPPRGWRLTGSAMPRPLAGTLLLVHLGAVLGALHLNYSDSPLWIFDRDHPYRAGTERLAASRGWRGQFHVVFDAQASADLVDARVRDLVRHPDIVAAVNPLSAIAFLVPRLRLDARDLERDGGGFAHRVSMLADSGALRAAVYVRDVDLQTMQRVTDHVREVCADGSCYAAGEIISYADFGSAVPTSLLRSLLTCLLLVALVLMGLASSRGMRVGPALLAASLWGPSLMLVVLAVARVPVTFLTCVFASVLVGLTGDNVIQFLFAARHRRISEGIAPRAGASVQIAVITALCALTFLGSSFVPSRRLGLLLGGGVLASLVGDVWILRALAPLERAGTEGRRP